MREPCIFWRPGHVPAGTVVQDIGSTLDFYKTFSSMADIEIPHDKPLDSFNLNDAISGAGKSPRETFFYYRNNEIYAIRHKMWKAHFITEGPFSEKPKKTLHDPPLLYHLGKDPSEKYDVAAKHPDIVEKLLDIRNKRASEVKAAPSRYEKKFNWR
jgi:arylsulfatase A